MATIESTTMARTDSPTGQRVVGYPLKRCLDVVIAAALLSLLSPLLLLVAVAIKLTSKGPVFYRQRRLGLNEKAFIILKFRSMREDADKTGPKFTMDRDPRITAIGRLLRATSMDELPQLWNVLQGHMSLFGPRPYVGFELEQCSLEQRELRASVRPGISGLAQVRGRSQLELKKNIEFDLTYAEHCNLLLDCQILLTTVWTVLLRRGVN